MILRFPSAFALGRTGVLHSSSPLPSSDHSELLFCRSLLGVGTATAVPVWLSNDARPGPGMGPGPRLSEPRSGEGVFDRCSGRRGPWGAGGGGARDWTEP